MSAPVIPLLLGVGVIAALAMRGDKAKAAPPPPPGPPVKQLPPKTTLQGEIAHMSVAQRTMFEHLMNKESDPAKVGAGAATFNFNGFPIASKSLGDRAKRMAKAAKPETLNDEIKRMAPEQRTQFQHLATSEADPAKVGAGGAFFNMLGFPLAGKFLIGKAKTMAEHQKKKAPPAPPPVAPPPVVRRPETLNDEIQRMSPQQKALFTHLSAAEPDPAKVGAGGATFHSQGFPLAGAFLIQKAKTMAGQPGGVSIQPVGPGVPIDPFQAELKRMGPQAAASVQRMLASETDPKKLVAASAQAQKNGFPITARKLAERAQKFTPLPVVHPVMSDGLKRQLAEALQRLNAQPDGTVKPPIAPSDIQFSTLVAGRLESGRFFETAAKLRALIHQAARFVASPPPEQKVDIPGVPPAMRDAINRALKLERDPARLRALVAGLRKLPPSTERDVLITALEALIAQIEAKNNTDETAEETEKVIKDPKPPAPKKRKKPKRPKKKRRPPPEEPPIQVEVPAQPKPRPIPEPNSPEARLAKELARHLNEIQGRLGMPRAKGDQNIAMVKRFQAAMGEKADGMPGPSTFRAMVRLGVSRVPLVLYWPRRATLKDVNEYKQFLLTQADIAEKAGQPQRAQNLRESAANEKGQGGVVRVTGPFRQSKAGKARKSEIQRMEPHQVKAVHDAFASNDAGRMLRVAQFMANFGFVNTAAALRAEAAKTQPKA